MGPPPPRVLLTCPPRSGKTTLASKLAAELAARDVTVDGILTQEIREAGERVGFCLSETGGPSTLIAHVRLGDGPMVGRYHVDVVAFKRLALPALDRAARRCRVAIIDELGQMELFSDPFIKSFNQLLAQDIPLVATIHARHHPVTDSIKPRPGIELLEVCQANADKLLTDLTVRLAA
jgi:nucleoside-triphosphatase